MLGSVDTVLGLQQRAGNKAVSRLLAPPGPPLPRAACGCGGACDDGQTVQRAADDIRIKGLFPRRADFPDDVFFECARQQVPDSEQHKLRTIAGEHRDDELVLRGLASEEGKKAANRALVDQRLAAVSSLLKAFKHRGPRRRENRVADAEGNIDYRRQRRVTVVVPGGAADNCAEPVVTCGSEVAAATRRASELVAGARAAMSGPLPSWLPTFQRFFRTDDLGVAALVLAKINTLTAFVTGVSKVRQDPGQPPPPGAHHRCENLCRSCGAGFTALAGDAPPSILFCPPFSGSKGTAGVASSAEELRAHIVLHESAHAAFGDRDLSKVNERAFPFLRTQDALANADSLAGFIRELVTPGQMSLGLPGADTGTGSQPPVAEALAFTHKWAQLAEFEASSTYNNAFSVRDEPQGWNSFGTDPGLPRALASYNAVAAEFGPMTPPPKAPTVDDRQRLAAVKDRFDRMGDAINRPLDISVGGATVVWSPGPGTTISVPADFAALPLGDRCRALLRALAKVTEGISPEAVEKYVRLAPVLAQPRGPGFVPL